MLRRIESEKIGNKTTTGRPAWRFGKGHGIRERDTSINPRPYVDGNLAILPRPRERESERVWK